MLGRPVLGSLAVGHGGTGPGTLQKRASRSGAVWCITWTSSRGREHELHAVLYHLYGDSTVQLHVSRAHLSVIMGYPQRNAGWYVRLSSVADTKLPHMSYKLPLEVLHSFQQYEIPCNSTCRDP